MITKSYTLKFLQLIEPTTYQCYMHMCFYSVIHKLSFCIEVMYYRKSELKRK